MAAFIRWTARILSAIIVLFFVSFIVAHLFGLENRSSSSGLTTKESFMFAALGTMLAGLVLAWKWEAVGGMISIIGYLAFAILEGHFFTAYPFDICLILAILYLVSWRLHRRRRPAAGE